MLEINLFTAQLQRTTTFEAGARAALGAVVERCERELSASELAGRGRILRAMVHIRPGGAYRRVFALDVADRPAVPYAPSASAFRWARDLACPLAIDVQLGVVERHDNGAFHLVPGAPSPAFDSLESRTTLLGRQATHLLVLPLRAAGADVAGMITIEADCRPATGSPFVWGDVLPFAQRVADAAAPFLFELPGAAAPPPKDATLPVTGATMQGLVDMLRVFAQQEETILLSGPTGAGKSRLARFCHACSPKAHFAFETIDLTTVPEDLQMAELFGWRRGAFTGAVRDSAGCLGRAEGGTLFIDEIDKLSLKAQSGLLRVLEERTYRPLGEGSGERPAKVRFIVGTNANLMSLVRSGLFREDLFFRIHVLPVRVPPLAQRRDEIVPWAEYMLQRRHAETGRGGEAVLTQAAGRFLSLQPWPGNLRQLDNILRRTYALFLIEAPSPVGPVEIGLAHVERALAHESSDYEPHVLLPLLQATAAAFVTEAERRRGSAPLDVDWADVLRGFVYGTAVQRLGDVDAAFRLLGKETLVQHRNHTKTLRRELQRVSDLYTTLGGGPSPFALLSDEDKK